jgi:cobalamin biosynthesis protein CobD/CbiB
MGRTNMSISSIDRTGPQRVAHENDIRSRGQLALSQSATGTATIAIGAVSLFIAFVTGMGIGVRAVYNASLTGVILAGTLFVAYVLLRATRAAGRERRHQHAEDLKERRQQHAEALAERRQQHADAMHLLRHAVECLGEVAELQGEEAQVIGDVLMHRRTARG